MKASRPWIAESKQSVQNMMIHGRHIRTALSVLVALLAVLCLRSLPGLRLVEEGEHEPNHAMSSQIKFAHGACCTPDLPFYALSFTWVAFTTTTPRSTSPVAGARIYDKRFQESTAWWPTRLWTPASAARYGQFQDSGCGILPHINDPKERYGAVPPGHDQRRWATCRTRTRPRTTPMAQPWTLRMASAADSPWMLVRCLCSCWFISFVCVVPKAFKHYFKHIVLVFLYLKRFKCHI